MYLLFFMGDVKYLNVEISDELMYEIKKIALEKRVFLKDLIIELIEKEVKSEKKRGDA